MPAPTISLAKTYMAILRKARFLGREGEVFLFATPADLARFCGGRERHDLSDIASWPEVADTDTLPLPADEDRYDLDRKSTRLNSSHANISYAVFCLKKKNQ